MGALRGGRTVVDYAAACGRVNADIIYHVTDNSRARARRSPVEPPPLCLSPCGRLAGY